jgi:outer membrane protein
MRRTPAPKAMLAVLLTFTVNAFAASADQAGPAPNAMPLSLKRAVEIAISPKGNGNISLAEEQYKQAKARSAEARSAFLPNLNGAASGTNAVSSLGRLGITQVPLPFGLKIPAIVGPYDVIDLRVSANDTFTFSSIRRYQASRASVRAADATRGSTTNSVAATVARTYLEALRTEADFEAAQSDVTLAQAVLKQAEDQKDIGTGTGIEVTRQKVELSNNQQRQLIVANERRKARLQLLRTLEMPLATEVDLTSKLEFLPVEKITVEEALARAFDSRQDLKAQIRNEESARLTASAVKYERLPSITGFGDYGTTGQGPGEPLEPTREFGASLNVSVFDGGRMDARRSESASQYRAEQVRTRDLREQVELEVREAIDNLNSAVDEVQVANDGLALSDNELTQARRRYQAGVSGGLEVTAAQTRLVRARANQIAALFNYNLARIDLGQATGDVQRMIQ